MNEWIPVEKRLLEIKPTIGCSDYVLLSFSNASMADIGRYEDGKFYPGDDDRPYDSWGVKVNAWQPLPEPYREKNR